MKKIFIILNLILAFSLFSDYDFRYFTFTGSYGVTECSSENAEYIGYVDVIARWNDYTNNIKYGGEIGDTYNLWASYGFQDSQLETEASNMVDEWDDLLGNYTSISIGLDDYDTSYDVNISNPEAIWIHWVDDESFWTNNGMDPESTLGVAMIAGDINYDQHRLDYSGLYSVNNYLLNEIVLNSTDDLAFNPDIVLTLTTSSADVWACISTILLHEIGHSLGIGHIMEFPSNEEVIMQPDITNMQITSVSHSYDILACRKLYDPALTSFENNFVQNLKNHLNFNYPNPFNPTTTISYSLTDNFIDPQIEIYNVRGQKVKSFQLEDTIGENSIVWNGKDAQNKSVSSGVYFYRLVNGGKTVQSRKMLMIK